MMTQPVERGEPVKGEGGLSAHRVLLTVPARGNALLLDTTPPVNVFHPEDCEQFTLDDTCTHQDASLAKVSANRLSSAGPEINGDV